MAILSKKDKVVRYTTLKDRNLGTPILFALSGFKQQAEAVLPEFVSRVAVISIAPYSEIFATSYYLQAIKKKYPHAEIVFFTTDDNYNAVKLMTCVDDVKKVYPNSMNKTRKAITKGDVYDILIDFGRWSRFEAILSCYINATYKIGFKSEGEGRHYPYNKVAEYDKTKSISDNYKDLLSLIKVTNYDGISTYRTTSASIGKVVLVEMFPKYSNDANRVWHEDNWAYIISVLSKRGYRVGIIGDKQYAEVAEKFVDELGPKIDVDYFVGRLDFEALCNEIKQSTFVIGIDNELTYLANYLGVPAVCLYGTNSAAGYAPVSSRFYSATANNICSGCKNWHYDDECVIDEISCMKSLSINSVESCIAKIVNK